MPLPPLPALPTLRALTLPQPGQRPRAPWSPPVEPLTEEETESLLARSLGFLQYAGETLDKPGAALRGLLAGEPEQLLNLIPFSDTLGITEPKERVSGRDLLEKWGIAPENAPGFDWWDVAGFGAEVALDPLILLSGPAKSLTAAGRKAAEAGRGVKEVAETVSHVAEAGKKGGFRLLGVTPKAIADEIRAEERGLMALKIPFAKKPLAVFGAGSEKAARFYEGLHYGRASPMRVMRYLWSKKVGGVWDPLEQMAVDKTFAEFQNIAGATRNTLPIFKNEINELGELYKELAERSKLAKDEKAVGDFLEFRRFVAEKASELDATQPLAAEEIARLFDSGDLPGVHEFSRRLHKVLDAMIQVKDLGYKRFRELGGRGEWLDDVYIKQFPRRPSNKRAAKAWDEQVARRLLPTGFPFASARHDVLKNIPEGSYTVNRMSREQLLTATKGWPIDDLKKALRAELESYGVTYGKRAAVSKMQQDLAYYKYLQPAALRHYQPALEAGRITPEELLDELKRLREGRTLSQDAGSLSDEAIEALKREGWKYDKKAEVLTLAQPSVAETLSKYLSKLPEEVLDTGLFDRSLVEDWMDYAEHLAVSLANLHTIHNILRTVAKTADEPPEGMMPIADAWHAVQSKQGRRLLHERGLNTFVRDFTGQTFETAEEMAEAASRIHVPEKIPQVLGRYVEIMEPKTRSRAILARFPFQELG